MQIHQAIFKVEKSLSLQYCKNLINFIDVKAVTKATLQNIDFWGKDLTQFSGLLEEVTKSLKAITKNGMKEALNDFMKC